MEEKIEGRRGEEKHEMWDRVLAMIHATATPSRGLGWGHNRPLVSGLSSLNTGVSEGDWKALARNLGILEGQGDGEEVETEQREGRCLKRQIVEVLCVRRDLPLVRHDILSTLATVASADTSNASSSEDIDGSAPLAELAVQGLILRPVDFAACGLLSQLSASERIASERFLRVLEEWRWSDGHGSPILAVMGRTHVGKSMLARLLIQHSNEELEKKRDECDDPSTTPSLVVAYHFCDARVRSTLDPSIFVQSVAAMLASRVPSYHRRMAQNLWIRRALTVSACQKDPEQAFHAGILEPLRRMANIYQHTDYRSLLLVVDGLDASIPITKLLVDSVRKFPPWLRTVITARQNGDALRQFDCVRNIMREVNAQDCVSVFDYARHCRPEDRTMMGFMERERGDFLCTRMGLDLWQDAQTQEERDHVVRAVNTFGPGLSSFLLFLFRQLFPSPTAFQSVHSLLELLVAAAEPLPLSLVASILGLDRVEDLWSRIVLIDPLLHPFNRHFPLLLLRHQSLVDWLTSTTRTEEATPDGPSFYCDLVQGHRALAQGGLTEFRASDSASSPYTLRHLLFHLLHCGEQETALDLALDFSWIEARIRVLSVDSLLLDYEALEHVEDVRILMCALEHASVALRIDVHQLAAQLLGRSLETQGSARLEKLVRSLHCRKNAYSWLRPLSPCIQDDVSLLRTFGGHAGRVQAVALSPDGRVIVSSTTERKIYITERDTGRVYQHRFDFNVASVALRSDGHSVVVGSVDGHIRAWDMLSGRDLWGLITRPGRVTSISVSEDGGILCASSEAEVSVWDVATNRKIYTFRGHTDHVTSVDMTRNGQRIVSGSLDCTVRVWGLTSLQEIRRMVGHTKVVTSVAFTASGRHVVSGSKDMSIRLWCVDTGVELRHLWGHTGWVLSVAVDRLDRYLVSSGVDETVRVWDIITGSECRHFEGHVGSVFSVAISDTGRYVVSGGEDGTVRIWDMGASPGTRGGPVSSVVVSRSGRAVVSGHDDGTLLLQDSATGNPCQHFRGHTSPITLMALSDNCRLLVSFSTDRRWRAWDVGTGEEISRILHTPNLDAPKTSVTVSHNGRLVAFGCSNGTVQVVDVRSSNSRAELQVPNVDTPMTCLTIRRDGLQLFGGNRDGSLSQFDISPLYRRSESFPSTRMRRMMASIPCFMIIEPFRQLMGHTSAIVGLCVSAKGTLAATMSADGNTRVWDVTNGSELQCLDERNALPRVVIPGGRGAQYLMTRAGHCPVRVTDTESGEEVSWSVCNCHADLAGGVAVSDDERYVVASSVNRTLRVWDTVTWRCCATFTTTSAVRAVTMTKRHGSYVLIVAERNGAFYQLELVPEDASGNGNLLPVPL